MREVCGKCKYFCYVADVDDYICNNPDSVYYGDNTGYEDECRGWEEKDS